MVRTWQNIKIKCTKKLFLLRISYLHPPPPLYDTPPPSSKKLLSKMTKNTPLPVYNLLPPPTPPPL